MVTHDCPTCGKHFAREAYLTSHLARKRPCKPQEQEEKIHRCECGKTYKHATHLSRHHKTCQGLPTTVNQLQVELAELRSQVQQMSGHTTNHIDNRVTNNHVTHIDNSINITLNSYGNESQQHLEALSYADLKRILKLTPDHQSLIRMISFIYLNEAVPENRTIRLDDKDSSVINVFKRGRWREQNADTVLYDLICRNRLRFVDLEEILSKNMAKGKFEELTQYLCKAEDMANSENADLHLEYAFQDLMSMIRDKIVV